MTSRLAEKPALSGAQRPRVCHVPPYVSTSGDEAIELAAIAGLDLDPWQQLILREALGERADGSWAAFEVGVVVPRQNGKGSILEARELAGLFLLGERLITHSAHQFDTSLEAFRRLLWLIEDTPDLDRLVKRVSRSHGEEGIELKTGQRIRFRTRTKGGGRGFSGDLLILDEAMILPEASHAALLFTLSARPNPQTWYTGSAVDQTIHEHGVVFSRVRQRGLRGDPRLAYFEHSLPFDRPDEVPADVIANPASWAAANPALARRIAAEHVANEHRSMDERNFVIERLGVGDWPATDGSAGQIIDPDVWTELIDIDSTIAGRPCFAFDVNPDRSRAAIAAAGHRPDRLGHIEIIEHKRGTGWVAAKLKALKDAHDPVEIVYEERGPAASLVKAITKLGVEVRAVNTTEYTQAVGCFYDAADQQTLRHLGTPELEAALKGAAKRSVGDQWVWSRKSSGVDISPLVAATLARWSAENASPGRKFNLDDYRIGVL